MDKLLHFDYLRLIKNDLIKVKEFLRFSGHETFHCKEQWLTKGVQLFDYKEVDAFNDDIFAIKELGVGKNMVKSIHHWLKAFGWIDSEGEITSIARKIIEKDIFLENESSVSVIISDVLGKVVLSETTQTNSVLVDELKSGIYFITVKTENGAEAKLKFIKE